MPARILTAREDLQKATVSYLAANTQIQASQNILSSARLQLEKGMQDAQKNRCLLGGDDTWSPTRTIREVFLYFKGLLNLFS